MSPDEDANSSDKSALAAANEALAEMRLSFDSSPGARSPSPGHSHINGFVGKTNGHGEGDNPGGVEGSDAETAGSLRDELERTQRENETLTMKYNNLVAKLTTMRTSVESKLKRDAVGARRYLCLWAAKRQLVSQEELDRQEQLVQQLTAQNEDLASTVETLKDELILSNAEAERSSRELEAMRSKVIDDSAHEAAAREREILELQGELERCRMRRDECEHGLLREKVVSDDARAELAGARREVEREREARLRDAGELARERERSANLQAVLEDFQAGECRRAGVAPG